MVYDAARIARRHVQMKSLRNKDIKPITCQASVFGRQFLSAIRISVLTPMMKKVIQVNGQR
jgi:maleate cis-trans isomerase